MPAFHVARSSLTHRRDLIWSNFIGYPDLSGKVRIVAIARVLQVQIANLLESTLFAFRDDLTPNLNVAIRICRIANG